MTIRKAITIGTVLAVFVTLGIMSHQWVVNHTFVKPAVSSAKPAVMHHAHTPVKKAVVKHTQVPVPAPVPAQSALLSPELIDELAGKLAEVSESFAAPATMPIVNNINVYPPSPSVPAPQTAPMPFSVQAPTPVPTPMPTPPPPVIQNNINIYPPVSLPPPAPAPSVCPKVGYYVLSHEPTTDYRLRDDHGNWNTGHMELVRECRNGVLHEFSRFVGHPLPD